MNRIGNGKLVEFNAKISLATVNLASRGFGVVEDAIGLVKVARGAMLADSDGGKSDIKARTHALKLSLTIYCQFRFYYEALFYYENVRDSLTRLERRMARIHFPLNGLTILC